MAIKKGSQESALDELEKLFQEKQNTKHAVQTDDDEDVDDEEDEDEAFDCTNVDESDDIEEESDDELAKDAGRTALEEIELDIEESGIGTVLIKTPQRRKKTEEVSKIGASVVEFLDSNVESWYTAAQLKRAGFKVDSNVMKRLLTENLIKKVGEKRGTNYTSINTSSEFQKEASVKVDTFTPAQKQKILDFLGTLEQASNHEISKATKIDIATARECLNSLIDEGLVVKEGQKRGTKYSLKS